MRFAIPLVAGIGALAFAGCTIAPKIQRADPHFTWEPPGKNAPHGFTVALVHPSFLTESKFGWYKDSRYNKTFLDSLQTDLQRVLIAKGFTVSGPYSSFDDMTFPNKKDTPLALVTSVNIILDQSLAQDIAKEGHIWQKGSVSGTGFIRFTMVEPMSEQKIWVKKVDIPGATRNIDVDLLGGSGAEGLNPFWHNKDNREAALVEILNEVYGIAMEKFWSYLNADEMQLMRKDAMEARKRKVF